MDINSIVQQTISACKLGADSEPFVLQAMKTYGYRLLTNYHWDFLRKTDTTTSVDGTAAYTLKGDSLDVGQLLKVRYDGYTLEYYEPEDYDRLTDGLTATDHEVAVWYISGSSTDGFPTITIFGTPSDTGKEIWFRYYKKVDESDPFQLMPGWMADILFLAMQVRFQPDINIRQLAMNEERRAIGDALWSLRKPGAFTRGKFDPEKTRRFYEINTQNGYVSRTLYNRVWTSTT